MRPPRLAHQLASAPFTQSLSRACRTARRRRSGLRSSRDVFQDLFFRHQIGDGTPELRILLLQILQFLGLLQLKTTVLSSPPVKGLLDDPGILSCQQRGLPLAHQHLNLPQLGDNLLGRERFSRHFLAPSVFQSPSDWYRKTRSGHRHVASFVPDRARSR